MKGGEQSHGKEEKSRKEESSEEGSEEESHEEENKKEKITDVSGCRRPAGFRGMQSRLFPNNQNSKRKILTPRQDLPFFTALSIFLRSEPSTDFFLCACIEMPAPTHRPHAPPWRRWNSLAVKP
ncbi:MAG: hypothetical protein JW828_10395 [Sedimentisphaerales bacterium]|nr:hypothetical protein [Sedimentisphaerales bacterium]